MNIISTLSGIVDIWRPGQGISDIANAGFENVLLDLRMYCSTGELENAEMEHRGYADPVKGQSSQGRSAGSQSMQNQPTQRLVSDCPEELQHYTKPLLDRCAKENIRMPLAIAPCLSPSTKREDLNILLKRLVLESIQVSGQAGSSYLIVSPLASGFPRGKEWEANREYYLALADTARQNRVTILLKNQYRDCNGHAVRGICSDAREAASWIDSLNEEAGEERFGFCMDVGVYNLCGQSMQEAAMELGSRVKAVILRDGNGQQESSLLPFTASHHGQARTDWLGLIRGLRETGFDGQLVLDFAETASSFSYLLRPQLLQLAKAVGEYFQWQIGMEALLRKHGAVVLFGAGNMCRNYMKCYGEKYPPLFTCDNNSALWGTTFCGLEVRNPESLRELPEDCAILICNIYYREIAAQLRDMGIPNPIEFFNDEYMPSFYFDRLPMAEADSPDDKRKV